MTAQQARPGFHLITAPLNKVLAYDHMRLTKYNSASFNNNAEECYDQIVLPHALLCCRRIGLFKTAAQMMGEILQNTIYKLKTGHGISNRTYFSTTLRRILGSGQGSGASPCIWTFVLDPILSSVSKKFKYLKIFTPSKKTINRIGYAFVDDTALFLILTQSEDNNEITPEYIALKLQAIAQDFERKLYSTGGILSLPKCFWYLIHWKWDKEGNATMATKTESPANIKLTKGNFTNTHVIHREEITKSRCTIGVRINPTGEQTEEYNFRLNYTKDWIKMISSTRLSKQEAPNAYRIVYIPSISHPLGAIYFTLEKCKYLQTQAFKTYLPKIGFNRKFPQQIIYRPPKYGGWGEKTNLQYYGNKSNKTFHGTY